MKGKHQVKRRSPTVRFPDPKSGSLAKIRIAPCGKAHAFEFNWTVSSAQSAVVRNRRGRKRKASRRAAHLWNELLKENPGILEGADSATERLRRVRAALAGFVDSTLADQGESKCQD